MNIVKKMWKKVKKWGPAGPPANAWILAHFLGSEKVVKKVDFFCEFLMKKGPSVSEILKKKFLFLPDVFGPCHGGVQVVS